MEIVELEKKHINSIAKLSKKLLDFHWKIDRYYRRGSEKTQEEFKNYLLKNFNKKNFKILVILDQKKPIGYFIGKIEKGKPHISPQKIGKIESAFLLERYRKKKLGEKAFKKLLEWFQKNKIRNVEVSVDSRNKIGVRAWKRYGFFEFQKNLRLDL